MGLYQILLNGIDCLEVLLHLGLVVVHGLIACVLYLPLALQRSALYSTS